MDQLDFYLADKIVPAAVIDSAGGILCYWEQRLSTQPQLAQMALDFLSAPGQIPQRVADSFSRPSQLHLLMPNVPSPVDAFKSTTFNTECRPRHSRPRWLSALGLGPRFSLRLIRSLQLLRKG